MEPRKKSLVAFRVTEKQREELRRKVKQSDMTQQDFFVRMVAEKEIINPEGLKELLHEMKKQGANLNQLAKYVNSYGGVEAEIFGKTMEEVRATWQSLKSWLDTHR